jgi:1-acyl-sn-glycerol-3-phosphate acyltransferase
MSSIFATPVLTPALRLLAKTGLWLFGWKVEARDPMKAPFVLIGAPHTSNWDLVLLVAALLYLRLDARWLGKHTLFRFPYAGLMRWLGGMPVDRSKSHNRVADIVAAFAEDPELIVCLSPEGTRKKVDRWRSGFYHIAHGAGVPIMMTAIDVERKSLRLLGVYRPTGDIDREMAQIQRNYRGFQGLRPENACDFPDLRDELGPGADPSHP